MNHLQVRLEEGNSFIELLTQQQVLVHMCNKQTHSVVFCTLVLPAVVILEYVASKLTSQSSTEATWGLVPLIILLIGLILSSHS